MAARKKADATPGFEERLALLETAVRDLEGDELSLEASLARYQEGVDHLRACRQLLDDAEARLAELVATAEDGTPVTRDLAVSDDGLVPADEADDA